MRYLTLLMALLVGSVVQAQTFALKVFSRSCGTRSCRQVIGYGTACYLGVVDNKSVFVTAAHNLENATHVYVYDGEKYMQMMVRNSVYTRRTTVNNVVKPTVDYAILDCERISYPKCFKLSAVPPLDGALAQADGCYMDSGRMQRLRSRIRVNSNGHFFMKTVSRGQSGGPIISNNLLVGVIHGSYDDGDIRWGYAETE